VRRAVGIRERFRDWAGPGAKKWIVAGGVALVLGAAVGGAAALVPRWVRSSIVEKARTRGLEVAVSGVHLGWGVVRIDAMKVALEGVPHIDAGVKGVAIPWGLGGIGDDFTIDQAEVVVDGPIENVRDEVVAWRDRHRPASGTPSGRGKSFHLLDARVRWERDGAEVASLAAAIDLDPEHVAVHRATGTAKLGKLAANGSGVELDLVRQTGAIASVSFASLTLSVDEAATENDAPVLPGLIAPATNTNVATAARRRLARRSPTRTTTAIACGAGSTACARTSRRAASDSSADPKCASIASPSAARAGPSDLGARTSSSARTRPRSSCSPTHRATDENRSCSARSSRAITESGPRSCSSVPRRSPKSA
jgi:hypothetical protein